ncbi:MAG TPA: L,D-transpeptidase family protein [Candidatus Pullilachnospira intestinigallinarum]|nr:L,D-transpeptidase family protein [Candidatus Pullilachnospira intestinigallinarum]
MDKKKKHGLILGITVGTVCAAALLGLGYYGYQAWQYRDRFFEGTVINGMDCGGMTAVEAREKIREQVEDYQLTIRFREDTTEEIPGKDFDYRYVSDGSEQKLVDAQNPLLWITGYFAPHQYQVKENTEFDRKKLEEILNQLPEMDPEKQIKPEDAFVDFQNGEFVIEPEKEGTVLLPETLYAAADTAVEDGERTLSAQDADAYQEPQVRRDDETLTRQMDQLNQLVKVTITYQLPYGKEKVLDGEVLKSWLVTDKEGNYSKDEDKFNKKLKQFVEELAEEVDTKGKDRKFHTTSGLDVTVEGGDYGWKVDKKEERTELKKLLEQQKSTSREPVYSSREMGEENNGLGKNYIEVNLTEQHLYYYKDNQVVLDSPFVSGKMTRDRFTPPGIFLLTYKQRDRVLKGKPLPNGQPSYQSPVSYWMPFNGGIGLHDASWRSKFGGTIYRYSGSHGCINLPTAKAAKIYEMIDKKTPIVCVYNDGYQLIG